MNLDPRRACGRTARLAFTRSVVLGAGLLATSTAFAMPVDIVNGNGTIDDQFISSNGGLSSTNFAGTEANGVSVWLRARNQGDQGPVSRSGDLFRIREATGAAGDRFSFEFQFSPRDGDTPSNSNYALKLELDSDPGMGVSFGDNTNTFFGKVFDPDGDDELLDAGRASGTEADRSWDDGDSVAIDGVTERDSGIVEFDNPTGSRDAGNLPEYVVANSWLVEWDFASFSLLGDDFGGAPGPGFYDIGLSAFELDAESMGAGEPLASVQITTQVGEPIPAPQTLILFATGLLALGGSRRRLRRAIARR